MRRIKTLSAGRMAVPAALHVSGARRMALYPIMLLAIIAATLTFGSTLAQANTVRDVGVIPATRSCPANSEAITIYMDDEDDSNRNDRGGNIGAIRSTSNTSFFFCRVDGAAFRAFKPSGSVLKPYAVLKLGANCPNGSVPFSRHFDNEDNSNNNSRSGNIFPNVSTSNTTLVFCLFAPGSGSTMTRFPDLGYSYNVWSSVDSLGFIRTDDEDDNNNNTYSASTAIRSIAQSMVSSGPNTVMKFRVAR